MLKPAVLGLFAAVVVLLAAGYAASRLGPWPSALFYRHFMDRAGRAVDAALAKHVPAGVTARLNERYSAGDPDAVLDVYFPSAIENTGRMLPAIVWVHGGGFIAGDKDQIANYLKILAAQGYTAIGIDYSLAPGARYPTPVTQANAALAYLQANATRLHIDASRFFLAGDSAGAQIAAQLAIVISAPAYAKAMTIVPAIARTQLRGVILYCGLYDPDTLKLDGPFGGFLRSVGWSYFGTRDLTSDPRLAQFSVVHNVTADFPPMFISAGNDDPLEANSRLLARTAITLGVPVEALFLPDDYRPPLPHEYQFNLDTDAGRLALERTFKFLSDHAR